MNNLGAYLARQKYDRIKRITMKFAMDSLLNYAKDEKY